MRHRASIAFALCVFATPAMAKDWKFTIQPADGQTLTYADGKPVIRSDGKGDKSGAALLVPLDRVGQKDHVAFYLSVKNFTDQPVNFTLANVQVTSAGAPISVLTPSDLQAEARDIEKKARNAAMWQAIATGLQAASASMPQTSTYSGNTFGRYGSSFTSGYVTTPGSQAAAAAIEANGQAQIQSTLAQGAARANDVRSVADERGFRPATLGPGEATQTALTLPPLPKKATDLRIVVSLNGETHTFTFPVAEVK